MKKIIGKRTNNKIKEYLVWWKNETKAMASWESKTNLVFDGLQDMIDLYEREF